MMDYQQNKVAFHLCWRKIWKQLFYINGIMYRLTYLMRVPVTVKDDDRVRSLQVKAKATGSGTEEEDEVLRSFLIEFLQECSSILGLGCSWK